MTDYQFMIDISRRIVQARTDQHLSQMELAYKASISRSFLGRIERMDSIPSIYLYAS